MIVKCPGDLAANFSDDRNRLRIVLRQLNLYEIAIERHFLMDKGKASSDKVLAALFIELEVWVS
jgi:hypothetical protein